MIRKNDIKKNKSRGRKIKGTILIPQFKVDEHLYNKLKFLYEENNLSFADTIRKILVDGTKDVKEPIKHVNFFEEENKEDLSLTPPDYTDEELIDHVNFFEGEEQVR